MSHSSGRVHVTLIDYFLHFGLNEEEIINQETKIKKSEDSFPESFHSHVVVSNINLSALKLKRSTYV
jgi:hypothetical protein